MSHNPRQRNYLGTMRAPLAVAVILSLVVPVIAQAQRVPWTTSAVKGSPEPPPPFKVVRAFPNLKFNHPLLLARAPGSDRLFVGEQDGVVSSFPNRPDAKADLFFDLRKEVRTIGQHPGAKEIEAVYGLVFHPDFE